VKLTISGITVAGAVLLGSAMQSFAIEGLRISVPCPDVAGLAQQLG